MRSLLRGLAGALLILGLAALTGGPSELAAQAKKDPKAPAAAPKKDDKKTDDTREKTVGISTSDGLSLNAYWFQGQALEKNPPDAVLMFPAPGNVVNDAWIGLAQEMSKKNFSVLLFDWRGCGMNAANAAGPRVIADKDLFWKEPFNLQLLKPQATYESKGLDYKMQLAGKNNGRMYYKDFLFNDLLAARFYLDRQNDNKKCNSGRIWIVTEKDGGPMGLAFIAAEFLRNSIYDPNPQIGRVGFQARLAGKDFVGMTVLSYSPSNSSASAVFNTSFKDMGSIADDAREYMRHRLAMIMVHGKKEGVSGSKSGFSQAGAGGDEEALKKNYKYLREIDNSKQNKPIVGIDLIDPMDSFGVQKTIIDTMVGVSKALPTNKEPLDREANKMTVIPRFPADRLGRK